MLKVINTTTTEDGTIELRGTKFEVQRMTHTFNDGETTTDTYLYGPRGAMYMLRPFIERKGDSGIRELISMKSGAPWRKRGNPVRVIEIAGVIEEAK